LLAIVEFVSAWSRTDIDLILGFEAWNGNSFICLFQELVGTRAWCTVFSEVAADASADSNLVARFCFIGEVVGTRTGA
jgi:hypothetical protein